MEPIQDDRPMKCPTCGATELDWAVDSCPDSFHGEPIQDDIETVRDAIINGADNARLTRAIDALDRLVAERDMTKLAMEVDRRNYEELVAERDRLTEERDRADAAYMHNLQRLADLADERDRLIQALEQIVDAVVGTDVTAEELTLVNIAREALTTEEEG